MTGVETAYVLDASLILKWFLQGEVLTELALAFRDLYLAEEIRVAAPSLMAYEFVNVLRYKDYLNSDHIEEIVQSLFDMQLEWRFPLDQEMLRSVEIARTHGISIYDAVYVTLAEALGAVLVTADEKLARRLTALPFVHFLGDFAKP